MASPSISEICRPESFARINTSNNCWMMKRLCSSSTAFTNCENPLMSGINSKPLFSMSLVLTCATHHRTRCASLSASECQGRYGTFLAGCSWRAPLRSKLDRVTVWRVAIGVCPRFLACMEGGEIRELLLGHQLFERCQPVLEVARAIIRCAAIRRRLELVTKSCRPLRPGEVPRRG